MKPNVDPEPAPAGASHALVTRNDGTGNGQYPVVYRPRPAAAPRPSPGAEWWQLATAAARHWPWLVGAAVLFAAAGAALGQKMWSGGYTATAQLVRHDTPDPTLFQPRPINPATLIGMVNSVELRTRIGARMEPQLTADQVAARVRIAPVPNSDLVNVDVSAADAATAAAQANVYAEEAVKFTQEMQARDARDAASYIRHQLGGVERELLATSNRLQELGTSVPPPAASAFRVRLDEARIELAELQSRYTDAHPLVQMQQARVAALGRQISGPPPEETAAATAAAPVGEVDVLRERARTLELERRTLSNRLQVTELLAESPPGRYRLFSPAAPERAAANSPTLKIVLFATFLGLCGLAVGLLGAVTDEAFDRRLRTPEDVRRVTQLPILARLGSIDKLTPEDRSRWGFRTWTALQSRLSATPNQGLVCGVTCSMPGEGRSVWIKLLADAANKCGFRVVVITTKNGQEDTDETRRAAARPTSAGGVRFRTRNGEVKSAEPVLIHEATLNDELLSDPDQAVEQMLAPEGTSIVQIPLPGWVWSLEHRKEWLASLKSWSNRENVVILVELPPAATPESVLLAQNLPNVLWLSDATKADALETRRQIETLRHARCNLVGAVMNRSNGTPLSDRFARWMPATGPAPAMAPAALALGLLLLGAPDLSAQVQVATPEGAERGSFSIVSPAQRAAWQQQLTLGPGDALSIALYGEVAETRAEVAVQPDGRISFLEARDVMASGLTVDQLRQKLDAELGKYRRSARTMVSPVAFRSKKYHMLGLVTERGSFTLDRPMTIVEAVARARGFETGALTGDVAELTDLRHAFLVRNGQRQPVDFARLFNDGDLSQNVAVEPGDYFYFPPAGQREVYVLGEVNQPGPAVLNDQSTTLRAIASRGGFNDRAWRGRVLVVRGSLTEPRAMAVNLSDVLAGRAPDVPLEPRDIVYVSARPWYKAEELLDEAARAFTASAIVYWASDKIAPVVPLPR